MLSPAEISSACIHRRRKMQPVNPDHHPATLGPRIFADTANIDEIRPLFDAGIINGVTTNPSLLKKAGATSWANSLSILKEIMALLDPYPVSLELTELTETSMLTQAKELAALGHNSVIKVPIGGYQAVNPDYDAFTGLKVLRALWQKGIQTNATLIFNTTQAFWAANAGATYVSPFLGRLADYCYANDAAEKQRGNSLYRVDDHKNTHNDQNVFNTEYVASGGAVKDAGVRLIHEIVTVFSNYDIHTEVLAASVRNPVQLSEVLLAGADILTVPANILMQVADHPLSSAGMQTFFEDSKAFTT